MKQLHLHKRKRIWSLLIAILCFQLGAHAQSPPSYYSYDISTQSGDAEIKDTLYLPRKSGRFPVMIIVPGSGRITRQDLGFALSIFSGLDIGTFIYDKRGLGESTGQYIDINVTNSVRAFEQRARDILAIVDELKKQENIDPGKLGLVGSSQGSWIIPIVASRIDDIALTVCISGAASSVGISDYYESLAEGSYSIGEATEKLSEYSGEVGFDPYENIRQMNNPGLWIYGGEDRSNPTLKDIKIIKEIKENENKSFAIHYYPSYNHEMIDVETGSIGEAFIPTMRDWIVKNLN